MTVFTHDQLQDYISEQARLMLAATPTGPVARTFEQTYRRALLPGRSFPDEQCRGYLDAPMDGQML